MVLGTRGEPLSWDESAAYRDRVKKAGIDQFIIHFLRLRYEKGFRSKEILKWGDELEGILVKFDHEKKRARLLLKASGEILPKLSNMETTCCNYTMEFADYMVECIPLKPYGGLINILNTVEANMRERRNGVQNVLDTDEHFFFLSTFPRLGCPDSTVPFTEPSYEENHEVSNSVFVSDRVIYPEHPRFKTLVKTIRARRGEKVAINIPIFKDTHTPSPFTEQLPDWDGEGGRQALPDHIYMDCMAFGMGSCCLQMTFQAFSLAEATRLYDQLAVLTPIMMALSAATPICRGYLTDEDSRWNVICQSVDDRTRLERGEVDGVVRIPKSRYSTIDLYISEKGQAFNDIEVATHAEALEELKKRGVCESIAKHVAHLYVRDPLAIYKENIEQDNETSTEHYENINSTNWQSMRFKIPPPDSKIGWRVEFRPLDVQPTAFENAAFSVFIVLLSRVILTYDLNILIPMSQLEENCKKAVKRDAIGREKFRFVKKLNMDEKCFEMCLERSATNQNGVSVFPDCCIYELTKEMTINAIINGEEEEHGFKGLVPILCDYLGAMEDIDIHTRCTIKAYLSLISKRASGELFTWAGWMREFVRKHPAYRFDSVVNEEINYDLLIAHRDIVQGKVNDSRVLPACKNTPQNTIADAQRAQMHRLHGCECNSEFN